jgi:hypothetical protein
LARVDHDPHERRGPTTSPAARAAVGFCVYLSLAVACEAPKDFEMVHVEVSPKDCVYCHESDYARAMAPLHRDGERNLYPKECASCHETQRFRPARFSHPLLLDGRHALTPCWQCHTGNPPVFAGIPNQCLGCHAGAFAASLFPGHANFQQTCLDCHSTAAWRPATGPHPEAAFPIREGVHVYPCLDCHDQSLGENGAGNANCVGCHDGVHARNVLDPFHLELGLSDYPTGPAEPNFCLSCHPNGAL